VNRLASIGGFLLLTTAAVTLAADTDDLPDAPPPSVASLSTPSLSTTAASPAKESPSTDQPTGLRLALPPIANPLSAVRVQKRLFGVLPNYRADQETADYKPLKIWEKFKIAERDTFDWPNFPLMAGFAMQTQVAQNGFHGKAFGRNFAEYYARSFGDALVGNFITEAIIPSLLHEDPRFFRSGVGSIWRRTYKAARQVLVTRTENGHSQFNFSEVLGNSIVVAITSSYYPDSRRLLPGAERVGLSIGNDVISNLMTEFWPDVKRKMQPMLQRFHFGN
jgi:hypothetical protein